MDWAEVLKIAEATFSKQGKNKAKLPEVLGVNPQYLTDIRTRKKKAPGPEFVLALINNLGFSPTWLKTGEGAVFTPPPPEKHPLIQEIEALIDQRLGGIEARLKKMENGLKKDVPSPAESSSGMYVAEPEPEYEVDDFEEVVYVDNIAAGPPISQSEDLSEKLKIPRRFIKTAPEDYYAAHVQGESMTAAGIPDGSTVLIHRTDVPRSGAIQLVRHGGKSTLKRLREIEDGGWRLCYEDNTGRRIDIGPGEEYQVQGDFAAVLPEEYWRKI